LFEGQFKPYVPSESIMQKFKEQALKFNESNPGYGDPFQEALPVIGEMIRSFQGEDLSKRFKFNLKDFIQEEKIQQPSFDPTRGELPSQPMPSPQVVTPPVPQVSSLNQGLTPSESVLLSREEQNIRLRQRGLA